MKCRHDCDHDIDVLFVTTEQVIANIRAKLLQEMVDDIDRELLNEIRQLGNSCDQS